LNEEFGAVIPAFNEAVHIKGVILGVAEQIPASNILVIDDGSSDGTVAEAEGMGVGVVRNPVNLGKGATLLKGFGLMTEKPGVEAVFTLDADGQHAPGEISAFIAAYHERKADIVIGSRMADTTGMPALRRFTNWFTTAVISLRAGVRIDDSQSGYRLLRLSMVNKLNLVTRNFDMESEILIKAARLGAVIISVPIATIYGEEKSKINPLVDTWRFLKLVIRSFLW
jgi:glycosyltransferase involved in cell wall biosynthesis